MSLISAEGIHFNSRGRAILSNASLSVDAKEAVTLIGPNGAGKSTLIRIMLGLLKPDSGQVQRNPKLRIGYMPQKLMLDDTLPITVDGFLSLASIGKPSPSELARCLELTNTQHLRQQPIQSLSGGELQRVLLARSLYRQPQLLVLDEPVQGVDITGQAALYQLIGEIKRETGCGVLMVSHDLHLVMASTDRVVCLNQHVCCEGHPDNVSLHPEFLQLFGEMKNPGVAVYTHHHDHVHDDDCSHS